MSPTLALTLSFEGIGLLTRVDGGWHLLDEVGLDSPDLAGDLARLRDIAANQAGEAFSTLLVVPNDQIKFLSLDLGRMRAAKAQAEVARTLEEQTPYAAEQLVFDMLRAPKQTQIAAVAKETLAEAEAFASEHHFNPVWFTAIPDAESFAGAPDFGPTSTGLAAKVSFDGTAIKIVGSGPLPEVIAEIPPAPEPVEPVATETEQEVQAEPPKPEQVEEVPTTGDAEDTAPAPLAFASRRQADAASDAPKLGGATRAHAAEGEQPEISAPRLDAELRFDPARVVAGLKADVNAPEIDGAKGAKAATRAAKKPAADKTAGKGGSLFGRRRGVKEEPAAPTAKSQTPDLAGDAESAETLVAALPGQSGTAQTAKERGKRRQPDPEKERMTIFGSRQSEVRGKPKYLGLILTSVLLMILALVALWATYFVEDGVAGLFGGDEEVVVLDTQAAQPVTPVTPEPTVQTPEVTVAAPQVADGAQTAVVADATDQPTELEIAAVDPQETLSEERQVPSPDTITDSAEIEALLDAEGPFALTDTEAEARYAVTGIWQKAPTAPLDIQGTSSDDIYLPSIDVSIGALDAVALLPETALATDAEPRAQNNPPPPGARFTFDDRGLVVASTEGTLSPDGILVFAGRPPVEPPAYPKRINVAQALAEAADDRLASIRPRVRPGNLIENNERATFGGRTLNELATIRPKLRPENIKAEEEADTTATALAVASSLRPRAKPANIAQLAARATPSVTEVAAAPAAATVTPSIPTTASVARQATIQNAINLKKINLIGVYGTSSNRRALVRLSSGRYKKVQVGDRLDGGKVAAIGDGELRYVKSGKNITLKMPKG